MPVLINRFCESLPHWIGEIKQKAHNKITSSNFAAACRMGDADVMRELILGLWPFVDVFPKMIIRASRHLRKSDLLKDRDLLNTLIHRSSQTLSEIQKDEADHRQLWLGAGRSLGLSYPADFKSQTLAEVKAWIDEVSRNSDSFAMFLRFAAIEIIAESISKDLLASEDFTSVLGGSGSEWFRVHAIHRTGISHEDLELQLGFGLHGTEPTKDEVNEIIQSVVDIFIAAADRCAELAVVKQNNGLSHP